MPARTPGPTIEKKSQKEHSEESWDNFQKHRKKSWEKDLPEPDLGEISGRSPGGNFQQEPRKKL